MYFDWFKGLMGPNQTVSVPSRPVPFSPFSLSGLPTYSIENSNKYLMDVAIRQATTIFAYAFAYQNKF